MTATRNPLQWLMDAKPFSDGPVEYFRIVAVRRISDTQSLAAEYPTLFGANHPSELGRLAHRWEALQADMRRDVAIREIQIQAVRDGRHATFAATTIRRCDRHPKSIGSHPCNQCLREACETVPA